MELSMSAAERQRVYRVARAMLETPGDYWSADALRVAQVAMSALESESEYARAARVNSSDQDSWRRAAQDLGPGTYWHEPDQSGITAEVRGTSLDNAGFWHEADLRGQPHEEIHVVLFKDGEPRYAVNLADLLGWAARGGPREGGQS